MRKILVTAAAGLAIPVLAASTASAASKPVAAQASYLRYPCNGAGVCPVLSSVTVSPGTSGIIAVAVMQGANTVAGAPEYFAQVKFAGPGHKWLSVPTLTVPAGAPDNVVQVGAEGSYSEPVTLTVPGDAKPGTRNDHVVFRATAPGERASVVSVPLTVTVT